MKNLTTFIIESSNTEHIKNAKTLCHKIVSYLKRLDKNECKKWFDNIKNDAIQAAEDLIYCLYDNKQITKDEHDYIKNPVWDIIIEFLHQLEDTDICLGKDIDFDKCFNSACKILDKFNEPF